MKAHYFVCRGCRRHSYVPPMPSYCPNCGSTLGTISQSIARANAIEDEYGKTPTPGDTNG